ncbi:MAG: 1-acyl-sn-glycerol-3-phosphate acyltransferase [Clostridia bacterium]|nr:1-acyl-sn-glycerol-3-phosphate acyltransferase [Clostridia bacterium]
MKFRFYKFGIAACKLFVRLFYPCEVENGKSLTDGKACIICSNHLSNMDPVFLNISQNRLIRFMAKQELFKNKVFGALITAMGAFPVNRGSDGGKAINFAEELLKDGECVGIFIEGTRSKTGKIGRGHMGALLIAQTAGVPIIPCCITGKKTFIKPFAKTKITYGQPVTCEELGLVEGDKRSLRAATNNLMAILGEMREEHIKQFEAEVKKR